MKKLLIIPIILLLACAIPTIPTVNVSDELKQIVYADETSIEKDGVRMLALGAEFQDGIYVSEITVKDKSVRVDYTMVVPGSIATGFFVDSDGDGTIDEYGETLNGIPIQYPKNLFQEAYEMYLIFAKDVSENGVYCEPEKVAKDA